MSVVPLYACSNTTVMCPHIHITCMHVYTMHLCLHAYTMHLCLHACTRARHVYLFLSASVFISIYIHLCIHVSRSLHLY